MKEEMVNIPVTDVFALEGFNPRYDFDGEDDLVQSILENGIIHPLTVYKDPSMEGKYILLDGERRLRASLEAMKKGWKEKTIPVIVKPSPKTQADALILSIVSNDGKPLLPIEEANAFKRLTETGMSMADIAKKIGKGDGHVKNRLLLLTGAPKVQEAVKKGKIGTTLATEIIRKAKGKKEEQEALLEAAKKDPEKVKEDLGLKPAGTTKLRDKIAALKKDNKTMRDKFAQAAGKKKEEEGGEPATPGTWSPGAVKKLVTSVEALLLTNGEVLDKKMMKNFVEQMKKTPIEVHMHFTELAVFWMKEKYGSKAKDELLKIYGL